MAMTALPDLLFVALFAIAAPLIDYSVFWPAHRRLSQADPAWSRTWLCAWTIGTQWTFVAFGVALWMASGRSLASLGLTVPEGWRLWTAFALLLLLAAYQGWAIRTLTRSPEQRAALRQQVSSLVAVLPHTRTELHWFGGVSLTAGICEEFLYRGYFIWVFAPWIGWWGAAALSLPFFAIAHLYQGWNGVLRTGAVGAIFTLVVAVHESLWPAIALHVLVDLGSGTMAWLALRERPETISGATQ
jgi:uncharacterized protein